MDHYQHHISGAEHLTRLTQKKRTATGAVDHLSDNSQSELVNQATFKTSHSRLIDASWESSQVDPIGLNELKILLSIL